MAGVGGGEHPFRVLVATRGDIVSFLCIKHLLSLIVYLRRSLWREINIPYANHGHNLHLYCAFHSRALSCSVVMNYPPRVSICMQRRPEDLYLITIGPPLQASPDPLGAGCREARGGVSPLQPTLRSSAQGLGHWKLAGARKPVNIVRTSNLGVPPSSPILAVTP